MSSLANLLIVSGNGYELYKYNGGSGVLHDDLFLGSGLRRAIHSCEPAC